MEGTCALACMMSQSFSSHSSHTVYSYSRIDVISGDLSSSYAYHKIRVNSAYLHHLLTPLALLLLKASKSIYDTLEIIRALIDFIQHFNPKLELP